MAVYLVDSEGHYEGVSKVMKLMGTLISERVKKAKEILIKPNFVSTSVELSATPVEAVRAVLDFIREVAGDKEVLIAEGPTLGSFEDGLRNYGYLKLKEDYNVEFLDLNKDPDYEVIEVYDKQLKRTIKVRVSRTALESDFRISVCRPKTHDTVVVTLAIKNMVVGSILNGDKSKIHQDYLAINMSIALLATVLMPHLAIIDGYVGMEGNGPVNGSPIRLGVAVAGLNAVEVDALTTWLMGFNPRDVGYLYYLGKLGYGEIDPSKIHVVGKDPASFRKNFRPHKLIKEQLQWIKDVAKGLEVLMVDVKRLKEDLVF
ncbi:MAG: hypothetical protein DRN15_01180 [Thermoprotei archaeon]|nr:MAG: hypothetical protein DRN15_01180 [Thermoprotei archaeon]